MTQKEKAVELVELFIPHVHIGGEKKSEDEREFENAKDAAFDCAEKIWEELDDNFICNSDAPASSERKWNRLREYWEGVKNEITNLQFADL